MFEGLMEERVVTLAVVALLLVSALIAAVGWAEGANPNEAANSTSSPGASPASPPAEAPRNPGSPSPPLVELTSSQSACLKARGWDSRVGEAKGVWVSVDEQVFRIIEAGRIVWQAPCATAAKGVGSEMNSFKTPLGWHTVARKVGAGAPIGQVFRGASKANEIWKPCDTTCEDLVLTRILMLDGQEPGKNKGGNVDSLARGIFIHGTNWENDIGKPSSHGCVRLRNADIIEAFDLIPEGTPLLITATQCE